MAKRKRSNAPVGKKAKSGTSVKGSPRGSQRAKPIAKSGAASKVQAMFKRTVARIKAIEARALGKLRGNGEDK
jgi:hypothetical protein